MFHQVSTGISISSGGHYSFHTDFFTSWNPIPLPAGTHRYSIVHSLKDSWDIFNPDPYCFYSVSISHWLSVIFVIQPSDSSMTGLPSNAYLFHCFLQLKNAANFKENANNMSDSSWLDLCNCIYFWIMIAPSTIILYWEYMVANWSERVCKFFFLAKKLPNRLFCCFLTGYPRLRIVVESNPRCR